MENPVNGSLFWLLLRYAELVNPNRLVKPAPAVSSSYYYECLRKSGNAGGAEESCAFLALGQLDGDIEQIHFRHMDDPAWQESLQAFKNYRAARCRLEDKEELRCRIRLSQEYLNELQYLP